MKKKYSIHTSVKVNYIPRIIGCLFTLLILGSIFINNSNYLLWGGILVHGLLWPHYAYYRVRKSYNSKKAEIVNLFIDAFIIGIWTNVMSYSLWPTAALNIAILMDNVATGGVKRLIKGLLPTALGIVISGALFGFHITPEASVITSTISAICITLFTVVISLSSYSLALRYKNALKKIEERSQELSQTRDALWEEMELAKKIQKELNQTNATLNRSLSDLKETQGQLVQSEKMAALGTLVAGVAHEINTPLSVAITATSLLVDKTLTHENIYESGKMTRSNLKKYMAVATKSATMILNNLNRAAGLVKSFKLVSVDQTTNDLRRFNVKTYVDDLLFSLRPRFKQAGHTVELNCPEHLEIESYPGVFSQIITNLLMNSLIHGFEDMDAGHMALSFFTEEDYLVLSYSDNGKGMDMKILDKMFDPFFTTKRSHGGTGLGMHILYNLVTQSLKGKIECTSTPSKGIILLIRVPLKICQSVA
jgi:signal transduction histidine kinase